MIRVDIEFVRGLATKAHVVLALWDRYCWRMKTDREVSILSFEVVDAIQKAAHAVWSKEGDVSLSSESPKDRTLEYINQIECRDVDTTALLRDLMTCVTKLTLAGWGHLPKYGPDFDNLRVALEAVEDRVHAEPLPPRLPERKLKILRAFDEHPRRWYHKRVLAAWLGRDKVSSRLEQDLRDLVEAGYLEKGKRAMYRRTEKKVP
jgi:hypothetical protein